LVMLLVRKVRYSHRDLLPKEIGAEEGVA